MTVTTSDIRKIPATSISREWQNAARLFNKLQTKTATYTCKDTGTSNYSKHPVSAGGYLRLTNVYQGKKRGAICVFEHFLDSKFEVAAKVNNKWMLIEIALGDLAVMTTGYDGFYTKILGRDYSPLQVTSRTHEEIEMDEVLYDSTEGWGVFS